MSGLGLVDSGRRQAIRIQGMPPADQYNDASDPLRLTGDYGRGDHATEEGRGDPFRSQDGGPGGR